MQSISILVVLAFACSCTLTFDVALNEQWNVWKQTNNKRYSVVEEQVRRNIWESNLKIVEKHNIQADLGVHTYWLGMNEYADLTINEFVRILNGYNVTMRKNSNEDRQIFTFNPKADLPDTVDWRTKGCVAGVKNQGQCGSNWAFAAVASIESAYCIKTGKLVSLSEQQLVDCSQKEGNMGCNGGLMDYAFQYVIDAGGIVSESEYPYQAVSKRCTFNASGVIVKVCGFKHVPSQNEDALEQVVANIGPVAVAIDASHTSFQLYRSGVYNEPSCSRTQLDHAIVVIGYGTYSGQDYWLLKNSWGTSWGTQGYIEMSRNKKNQCGIATMASYPIIC